MKWSTTRFLPIYNQHMAQVRREIGPDGMLIYSACWAIFNQLIVDVEFENNLENDAATLHLYINDGHEPQISLDRIKETLDFFALNDFKWGI